jgi:hypothetical protein
LPQVQPYIHYKNDITNKIENSIIDN